AMSSARLAAHYPAAGGTYVYGRERLGEFWGHLAGWSFVVGKTASCAAMALTVGLYAWPAHAHTVAVAAVVTLTAITMAGGRKSMWLTRVLVTGVLAVLAAIAAVAFTAPTADSANLRLGTEITVAGVFQAAGLLFFAFAGYARIATLGEEVRDPARTIPRAVPLALGITLGVYVTLAVAALLVLGPQRLAATPAPLSQVVVAAGARLLEPVVRVSAAVAALGALLTLVLGVSRTTLAMARDGHLPRTLATVHPRLQVPHHAELAVGVTVALLAAVADLRAVIGFSSFGVLVYYAVANTSAWTLPDGRRRVVPAAGLLGCLVLAATLPLPAVLTGTAVLAAGALVYAARRLIRKSRRPRPSGPGGR
ncbi:APC family permease, partial [Nocardia sp. NPDC003345]